MVVMKRMWYMKMEKKAKMERKAKTERLLDMETVTTTNVMKTETFLTFLKMMRNELFWMSFVRQMRICMIDNKKQVFRLDIFTQSTDRLCSIIFYHSFAILYCLARD